MSTGFLSGDDEMGIPELVVIKAQLCECTENTNLYTLKGHTLWYMDYLNKMVIKKIGGEFPGSPVVRDSMLSLLEPWFNPLESKIP